MTRLNLVAFCQLLLLASLGHAELHCSAPIVQAGQVNTGPALRHRFVLTNTGKQRIELTGSKSSCGCVQPRLEKTQLEPGEQTGVSVEVNTATQPGGPSNWRTTVHYREGQRELALDLFVRAHLVPTLSIGPASLLIYTDSGIRHDFTLTEYRDRPVEIRATSCRTPHIQLETTVPRRQGNAWVRSISVRIQAECPEGKHEDVLVVHTTDAEYPELKAPFTLIKRTPGVVQATPATVSASAYSGQPLPARIILLSAANDQTVLVDAVETSHACLRCTFAAGPGTRSTLRLTVDREKLPPGSFAGSLQVKLRQPTGQVVTIPIQIGSVQGQAGK